MSKESTVWKLVMRIGGLDCDTAILECRMLVTDAMLLNFAFIVFTLHEQDSQVHLSFQGRWEVEDCLLEGKSLRPNVLWRELLYFVPVRPISVHVCIGQTDIRFAHLSNMPNHDDLKAPVIQLCKELVTPIQQIRNLLIKQTLSGANPFLNPVFDFNDLIRIIICLS